MEEKALPSPFRVNPVCNVNVELDHLRAEIARLRQQQDGIRPVVASVEANHIPVEHQVRYGLRGTRVGEASHPGPTTGPTRWDTSSDEELVSRLCEVRLHPPPSARGRCGHDRGRHRFQR